MAGLSYSSAQARLLTDFDQDVRSFVVAGAPDDDRFAMLLLKGFALQYESVPAYRSVCDAFGITPDSIDRWEDIPAVSSFPHAERLRHISPHFAAERFRAGRTVDLSHTRGPFFPDSATTLMQRLVQTSEAKRLLFPDCERLRLLLVTPTPLMAPGMVMASGLARFRHEFGGTGSAFLIGFRGFDAVRLVRELRSAEASGEPLAIMGATFGIDYLLSACAEAGVRFQLPPGSRICDSGGFMGRYVRRKPADFIRLCGEVLSVPPHYCINALWTCESTTVYFDTVLQSHLVGRAVVRCKQAPAWTRVIVVDPLSFQRLPKGEVGLLRLYDLSNRCMGVVTQTDKLGVEMDEGFDVLGKLNHMATADWLDRDPPHPGGRIAGRIMEFALRKRLARAIRAS